VAPVPGLHEATPQSFPHTRLSGRTTGETDGCAAVAVRTEARVGVSIAIVAGQGRAEARGGRHDEATVGHPSQLPVARDRRRRTRAERGVRGAVGQQALQLVCGDDDQARRLDPERIHPAAQALAAADRSGGDSTAVSERSVRRAPREQAAKDPAFTPADDTTVFAAEQAAVRRDHDPPVRLQGDDVNRILDPRDLAGRRIGVSITHVGGDEPAARIHAATDQQRAARPQCRSRRPVSSRQR